MADIEDVAARELAKLDAQEAELWLAWERSKRDKERTTQKEKRTAVGGEEVQPRPLGVSEQTTTRTTEGRLPEARYMDLLIEIGERRARLLGLDKGIKIDELTFDFRELVRASAERKKQRKPRAEKAARDAGSKTD